MSVVPPIWLLNLAQQALSTFKTISLPSNISDDLFDGNMHMVSPETRLCVMNYIIRVLSPASGSRMRWMPRPEKSKVPKR